MKKVKRHPLQRKLLAAAVAACFAGRFAYANPVGPVVVSGQASFAANGRQLAITNTPGTIINWQQFSIQSNEATRFIQQSAASAVLNRVIGVDPSKILGTLQSNGRVFLINPNGILFGAGAQVDVAGLVASTLNLRNEDFLAGRMNFIGDATRAGAIVNQGHINAINGGGVLLIGSAVDNQGVISAPNGDIVLAAGKAVRVAEGAAPQLQVEITAPADKPLNLSDVTYASRGIYAGLVRNSGVITANSVVRGADGSVVLKASGDVALAAGSSTTANGINGGKVTVEAGGSTSIAGVVEAKGEGGVGGTVSLKSLIDTTLESGGKVNVSGTTGGKIAIVAGGTASVSGAIEAKGEAGTGGQMTIAGSQTGIFDGARVDASGATGGGTILVGGDAHGVALVVDGSPLANSRRTFVGRDAELRADAIGSGDGGKVIVWADDVSRYYGSISARGGANGGNGGFVETSGKGWLDFQGLVDTRAPYGRAGTLLLDPTDITISTSANSPTSAFGGGAFSDATTTPSNLNVTTLTNQLGLGSVIVTTASGLLGNGDITVNNAINYSSTNSLTLSATRSITVAAGSGGINNASAGDVILTGGGAGSIAVNESIITNGGNINLTSGTGGISSAAATKLVSINAGSGLVTVNAGGGAADLTSGTLQTSNATAAAIGISNATTLTLGNVALTGGGVLSVNHSGAGAQVAGTVISGTGGLTKAGAGTLTLSQTNTYTGTTTVNAGTLSLAGGNAIVDTGAVVLANAAGATLNLAASETIGKLSGGGAAGGNVTLNANTLTTGDAGNTTFDGVISGTGGLTKQGSGTFTLTNANTQTGALNANGGNLTLSGVNGSTAAATVTVNSGATLTLDNSGANNNNRLTGALTMNGGELVVTGNAAVNTTEALGGLTVNSGYSTVTVTPNAATNAQLTFASAARAAGTGATILFRGTNLGATAGANVANINFTAPAGLGLVGANTTAVNKPIVGWAMGDTSSVGSGTGFVTYNINPGSNAANTTGIRPLLLATEYTLNALTAGNNIRLTAGTTTAPASLSINSLLLDGGTLDFANNGRTETITSGALARTSGGNITSTNNNTRVLAFGGVEAIVHAIGSFNIGANITGTAGLTKSGAGTLTLDTQVKGITGGLTVDSGTLRSGIASAVASQAVTVRAAGALDLNGFSNAITTLTLESGATSGASVTTGAGTLTLGGNVALNVNGTGATGATISGNLGLGAATRTITASDGAAINDLTVSALISGAAGVGLSKAGAGTLTLSGANTYTGVTTVSAGTLSFNSIQNVSGGASALGAPTTAANGTIALASGATLQYTGTGHSSNRVINLTGAATVDASGSGALTLSGGVTGAGQNVTLTGTGSATESGVIATTNGSMTKNGTGTWTLSGANTYAGATTINAGVLSANTLALGGAASSIGQSTNAAANLVLGGGTLQYTGGSLSTDRNFTLSAGTTSTIDVSTAATTLTITGASTATTGALTKAGSGTLKLSGANLFTGASTVNAGTLQLGVTNAIGSGSAVTLNGTSTFDLNGFSDTIGSLAGVAGTTVTSGVAGSVTLSVGGDNTTTAFVGVIQNGAGTVGVTKQGTGTFTLSGANTYTGTTNVNAGTLSLQGGSAIADTDSVVLANVAGATLNLVNSETIGNLSGGGATGGNVTLNANTLTTGNASTTSYGGSISGGGGVTKQGSGTFTLSGTNTYTGTTTVNAGTLSLQGGSAIADAGAVTLANVVGATLNLANSETIGNLSGGGATGGNVTLNANTLTTGDASTTSYGGAISGGGAVTKQGSGTFTLSGTNTYTGTTTVNAGTLSLQGGSAIADAGAVTLANVAGATLNLVNSETIGNLSGGGATGGNVTLNANTLTTGDASNTSYGGAISGTGGLTKQGSGTFTLTGSNGYSGTTTISAGTLQVGSGGTTGTLGSGNVTDNATLTFNRSNAVTVSNAISGTGALVQAGAGTTSLSGNNTYSGTTTISAGMLSAQNANALGSTAVGTTVTAGATLDINGVAIDNEAVTIDGTGVGGNGALTGTGTASLSGGVSLGATTPTIGGTGTLTLSGVIANGTGNTLTKTGSGTLVLSGANTYTAVTTIGAGTLQIGSGGATGSLGSGNVTDNAALVFNLSSSPTVANVISGTGTLTQAGTGTLTLTGANNYSGGSTISGGTLAVSGATATAGSNTIAVGANTLEVDNSATVANAVTINGGTISNTAGTGSVTGGSVTLAGASGVSSTGAGLTIGDVISGAFGLTKNGAGTVTLTGANTYTTTTISAGTLQIGSGGATGSLGSGNVTDNAALVFNLSSAPTVANVISGTGTLTQAGAGTLTLSGANAYDGATNINAGTLVAANATALGSTTGGTVVAAGANLTISNAVIGAESVTLNGGTALTGIGFAQLDGNVTLATADSTISIAAGGGGTDSFYLLGVISGAAGLGINKADTGTLNLLGANTYTGATTITTGKLALASTGTIAASSGVANSGTFELSGNKTIAALTGTGGTTVLSGSTLTIGDARNFSSTYSGVISGSGGLAKEGTGTLTLSGFNTYDGDTSINAGTLVAANNKALGLGLTSSATVAAGANLTLSGVVNSERITLNGGSALTGTGTASQAGNVTLATADSTITVGLADALTLSGIVSGGFGIAKAGAGTLVLSGSNTYGGNTTISAGTLKLGAANAIPNGAGTGNVSVTGTFDLNGFSATINGLSGAGTVDNTAAATTPTLTVGNNDQTSTFSGVIQNTAGTLALTKMGTGTLTLSGANTYTGATTINNGTLSVASLANGGAASNIGASSSAAANLVLGGGTLRYTGATASTDRNFTLSNGTTSVIDVSTGATNLTLNGASAATTGALTKMGAGTLTLGGANAYTGATNIAAGTLTLGNDQRIADSSAVTVAAGATFDLSQYTETIGSLAGAGTVTKSGISNDTLFLGGDNTSTTFSGVIQNTSGTLNLTKQGTGTFTLSGANTYDGATTVNAGTVRYGANNATGTGNVIVNDGGIYDLAGFSGTIGFLTVNSGVIGGSVTTGAGTLTLGGNVSSSGGAPNASISGNLDLGAATRDFAVADGELSVSAVISGAGGVKKVGDGTLTFSAVNTYTGTTTVNVGTLNLSGGNAIIDTGAVVLTNTGGATLNLLNSETIGSLAGGGGVGGNVTLNANTLTTGDGSNTTYSGVISGTGGLIKKGTGTFELDGANTYTGATNIAAGTLAIGSNERISDSSAVTVAAGATFDLKTRSETIGSLAGAGTVIAGATADTLTVGGDNTSTTFSGVIQDGPGPLSLTKQGTAVFTLSGNNTYHGDTTISAGTLRYGVNNALPVSDVIVNDGGTFDLAGFSGTIGALTVNSGVTGGSVTTGAGTLTLGGTVTSSGGAANASISGNLNLGAATRTFNVSNGTLSVSAAITGGVGLTKAGSGMLTLSGTNTYTGTTQINQGTVRLAGGNAISDTGAINVANSGSAILDLNGTNETIGSLVGGGALGGTVTLGAATLTTGGDNTSTTFGGVISGTGGLTKQGTGTFELAGANTYTGATNIAAGTLKIDANERIADSSAVTVAAGATFNLGNFSETIGSLAGAGLVTAGPTADTLTVGGNNTSTTFSGVIQNTAGTLNLTKQGTGTFTLSGANTYDGATTINAGTLNATTSAALGDGGAANTLIFNGGTLQAGGTITSPGTRSVTMTGAGTIDSNGNTVSIAGTVNGAGALNLIGNGTVTLGGAVGGTTPLASLTQNAATTLNINGGLVRTAGDQIYGGAVTTGGATNLTSSGGALTATGAVNATAGTLTLSANPTKDISFANAGNDFGTVAATNANNVTLSDQNAIVLGASTISGALLVTSGGLISQSGALTVTGNATFDTSANVSVGSVSLIAGPTITVDTSNIGGNLIVQSTAGDIHVPTGKTVTVAGTIDADAAGNVIVDGTVISGRTRSLRGSASTTITLGADTDISTLTLPATGNIAIILTNGGTSTGAPITAQAISLTNPGNSFGGQTTLNTAMPGGSTTAGTYNLTQSAPVTLGAAQTLAITDAGGTGAVRGNVTLFNGANNFSTVAFTGGNLQLADTNALTLGVTSANAGSASTGTVLVQAIGNLTLGGNVSAAATGDSLVLAAGTNFDNSGGFALNAGSGRFLVWSADPSLDNRGGLGYNFKQYNATYGVTTVAGTGNGFLYTTAPTITPSLVGTTSKTYDGTTSATLTAGNYSFSGAIDGDVVTLNNPASGTYIDRNVGTNKNVSVSGIGITSAVDGGANVYGYQVVTTANANIGTITQRAITVSSQSGQSKTYGADDPNSAKTAYSVTSGTLVGGDTLSGNMGRVAGELVGNYSFTTGTTTVSDGNSGGNYAVTFNGATNPFQISQAALTGTIANQTKTYGQNDPALAGIAVNLGGLVNRTVVDINGNNTAINDTGNVSATLSSLTRTAGELVSGSPYNITAGTFNALTGSAAGNYNAPTVTGSPTLTISQAALTGSIANQSKVYGANDPTLFGIGVNLGGVINNPAVTTWNGIVAINDTGNVATTLASLTRNAGEVVSGSPYNITAASFNALTGTAAGNYNAPVFAGSPTLTVTPANLTGLIANQSKVYGANDPTLSGITVNLGGVINNSAISTWNGTVSVNDTGNVATTLASLTRTAGEVVSGSPYSITSGTFNALTGSAAGNYNAPAFTGSPTLTVTPASLTGTIANQSKVYGADDPLLSGIAVNLGGLINRTVSTWNGTVSVNDTGNVATSLSSLTRTAGEVVSGSPYSITAAGFNALTGTAASNYNAPAFTGSPTLTVTPATLTGAIANQSKVYGADDPLLSGIAVNLGGVINNGAISTWNGSVSVNDTGNVATTLSSLTRTAGEVVSGSPYSITSGTFNALTGSAAGNYNAPAFTGSPTLTVTPAALTGTVTNQTKVYGADDPALAGVGVTLGGLVNRTVTDWVGTTVINDSALTSNTTALTRTAGETVALSPYSITSGTFTTPSTNYTAPTLVAGSTLTVTPASLTGTIANQTKGYGQDDPSLAGIGVTLTGLVVNPAVSTWNGTVAIDDSALSSSVTSLTRVVGENVGGYNYTAGTLALSGGAAGNYSGTVFVPGGRSLNITPAPLTITADDKSRPLDVPNPPFTASYSGLQFGETPGALTGTIAFATPAVLASPPGAYVIIPSGQTSTNYLIIYLNGTLTVVQQTPAAPTVVNSVVVDQMTGLQRLGLNDATRTMSYCGDKGGASGGAALASTVVTVAGQCGVAPGGSVEVLK